MYIDYSGHMTKMASMSIYRKNRSKMDRVLSIENKKKIAHGFHLPLH